VIARAPGKIVISGAYAVLEGAPAVVTAVDRYASADATRRAAWATPEVQAALPAGVPAPWFDASELRAGDRKLGLGSSAAILVASLGAIELARLGAASDLVLREAVLSRALAAHARAQGGGSGIDVAASAWGGTLICRRNGDVLDLRLARLPATLHYEVWAAAESASTPEMIARVRALAERDPGRHAELMARLCRQAERGADAVAEADDRELLAALVAQGRLLEQLGDEAGAPIVIEDLRVIAGRAAAEGAAVIPAGAGGGDVALFAGPAPPSARLRALALEHGHRSLDVVLEARGVHATSRTSSLFPP
jgi:phosphomevalonate kinase